MAVCKVSMPRRSESRAGEGQGHTGAEFTRVQNCGVRIVDAILRDRNNILAVSPRTLPDLTPFIDLQGVEV